MKNKNIVLLALAVGCGLVAAFLTAKLGAGNKTEMIPVLVAAKNLDQGTKLDKIEEQFVRKPYPKESVPPEFVDDISQLKGKILQKSLRAGSHCTMADITQKNTIDLPVDAKSGVPYKAMALKVAPETIVGGLVLPGCHVDVVSVERLQNGKTVSQMILQNVLVVGVNENVVRPEDSGFIKNAQTVTLAVKQSEGMFLALAQKRGDVFLMLRSPDDDKVNKGLKQVTDYAYGKNDPDGPAGTPLPEEGQTIEKAKVLVAKETVPAGTKITDPARYFVEEEWTASTVKANFIVKLEDVKGKTVTATIPANLPPTRESFDEAKAPAVAKAAAKDEAKLHTITFQVGGNTPWHARYRDGQLEEATNAAAGAPAAAGGSAVIKPTEKKADAPATEDKGE